MSVTIGDIRYIDPSQLKQWIKQGNVDSLGNKVLVVDVRGHDYIGGHITGSVNLPYRCWSEEVMSELLRTIINDDIGIVVFHCAQSQQRGPSAALKFMRFLNIDDTVKVRVLRGGFIEWQSLYRNDPSLVEAYVADLWE
ncbi:hypothetical protein C6P45_002474 [Maudiozyma exigua]|uniref:Rhodanese domain-containing protein n=1 Tax=Maudiozyma exigua TaxID=34358 RepID=A0A9P7BC83_MAUEX|nr:hypothetical protein C6P45_002474 [Kazachstania exigua]